MPHTRKIIGKNRNLRERSRKDGIRSILSGMRSIVSRMRRSKIKSQKPPPPSPPPGQKNFNTLLIEEGWENYNLKLNKSDIEAIEAINNFRKDTIEKVFNCIYDKLNTSSQESKPNFFKQIRASDNQGIKIWTLNFESGEGSIVLNDNVELRLGGTGTKSNSDLDFDIKLKETITTGEFELIKECITNEMEKTAFLHTFDTNFYLSPFDLWVSPMPNNINKYYIGIFNKLTCRYLKIKVVTVEGVSEDEIILSDDDAEVIAKFYIQKDTKGSYDDIKNSEKNFYMKYAEFYKNYLEISKQPESERIKLEKEVPKILLFQAESYVFPLSTLIAVENDDSKIDNYLVNMKKSEDRKTCFLLSAIENFIDYIFSGCKVKYLLRLLKSVKHMGSCSEECFKNLTDALIGLMQKLKDSGKYANNNVVTKMLEVLPSSFDDMCNACPNKIDPDDPELNKIDNTIEKQTIKSVLNNLIIYLNKVNTNLTMKNISKKIKKLMEEKIDYTELHGGSKPTKRRQTKKRRQKKRRRPTKKRR